jgi:hypothetical protein
MHLCCQVTREIIANFRSLVGRSLELCSNVKHLSNMLPISNCVSLKVTNCPLFDQAIVKYVARLSTFWQPAGIPGNCFGLAVCSLLCPHKEKLRDFSIPSTTQIRPLLLTHCLNPPLLLYNTFTSFTNSQHCPFCLILREVK